jgi:hypothetical protein
MEGQSIATYVVKAYSEYSKEMVLAGDEPISLEEYVKKIAPLIKEYLTQELHKDNLNLEECFLELTTKKTEDEYPLILKATIPKDDLMPHIREHAKNIEEGQSVVRCKFNFELPFVYLEKYGIHTYNGLLTAFFYLKGSNFYRQFLSFINESDSEAAYEFIKMSCKDHEVLNSGDSIIRNEEFYDRVKKMHVSINGKSISIEIK